MDVAETAETMTMESPLRTVTEPSARRASLPVSMVMGEGPTWTVTLWIILRGFFCVDARQPHFRFEQLTRSPGFSRSEYLERENPWLRLASKGMKGDAGGCLSGF